MWIQGGKKPVGEYLFIVFIIAWVSEFLLVLGGQLGLLTGSAGFYITYAIIGFGAGFAPSYAIYIVLKRHKQISGIKEFCKLYFKSDSFYKTILITLAFYFAMLLVNVLSNQYLGQPWYYFILLIPLMIIGGGMEEPGWRGFLQPVLEEKLPFPVATLLMGVIWAVWHLPLWLVKGTSQSSTNFFLFLCFCIFLSFVLAALYKLTHCVFACTLLHAWSNVLSNMFVRTPDLKMILIYSSLAVAAAVIWILVDRKTKAEKSVTKAV